MHEDPIVIVSALRTPLGAMQGELASLSANELGAIVIKANLAQTNLDPKYIDEVIMGCVLQAGQGQAPARQAAIKANIPDSVGAVTINKMCGSSLKAIMLAHDSILANCNSIVVAGGMESMTSAPYLLQKARSGYRLGHSTVYDHMFLDGLEDAYDKGKLMGAFAEDTAAELKISRSAQDEFAMRSLERALHATKTKLFAHEITKVVVQQKTGPITIDTDEVPRKANIDKIPQLKPAFKENGTVTAANSSSISDGAASTIVMKASTAKKYGLKPLAKIIGHSTNSQSPALFTTAPIGAIQKLLHKINWHINDVDLFEINEAFAVVTLAAVKELKLDMNKVNIYGGACALGHPIGASGARIMCTLINALTHRGKKRGIATLCIGGGEAVAMAIEI